MVGRCKDDRAGHQLLRRHAWKIRRVRLLLGHGDVARRFHKCGELLVGDLGLVHPESVHGGAVDGTRVRGRLHPNGIVHVGRILRAHGEFAAGNPDHALGSLAGRRGRVLDGGQERGRRRHCDGRGHRRRCRAHDADGQRDGAGNRRHGDPRPRASATGPDRCGQSGLSTRITHLIGSAGRPSGLYPLQTLLRTRVYRLGLVVERPCDCSRPGTPPTSIGFSRRRVRQPLIV